MRLKKIKLTILFSYLCQTEHAIIPIMIAGDIKNYTGTALTHKLKVLNIHQK